jgi:enoyl-CoA hydratase
MAKIEVESKDRVFIVSINRPEARNAIDTESAGLLEKAVRTFQCDIDLRVMILTGRGGVSFCAGADLKSALDLTARPGADLSGPMGCSRITDVQKPIVAAINGYCLAGGMELACWRDFRVGSEGSMFGVVNRRWGVPLIDDGTQRLSDWEMPFTWLKRAL